VLGEGRFIPGLEQGVATMHVGGLRRLVIPPALAFGDTQRGSVPPNSTIVIDVELIAIR
jgi:FKBP-type peptidyl-prolyl cis-trans isomerase